MFLASSLMCLFLVITGMTFWGKDYLITVLHAPANYASVIFAVVGLFGPSVGLLLGSCVFSEDESSDRVLIKSIALSIMATFMAMALAYANNYMWLSVALFGVFMLGGMALPSITNEMICSSPKDFQKQAAAI